MIRHAHGNDFLLIAQNDHALFSGHMAMQWGNDVFSPPLPLQPVVDGVAMHDSGWPLHDRAPTLNARQWPLDVLETPPPLAAQVWSESVRRASEHDSYSGLLVSLHVLGLSALSQSRKHKPPRGDLFELNKFQHRQVEVQEDLRRRLGLNTDRALQLGLAAPGTAPAEDLLLFNFNILKALDRISLDVCSGASLFHTIDGIFPRPGEPPINFAVGHPGEFVLSVDPWPFSVSGFDQPLPCKRLTRRDYATELEFRRNYEEAATESIAFRVTPR